MENSSDSFSEEDRENSSFGLDDDAIKTHLNSINKLFTGHRKQISLPKKFVFFYSRENFSFFHWILFFRESINFNNNECEEIEHNLRKSTDLELLHEYQLVIEDLEKKVSSFTLSNKS